MPSHLKSRRFLEQVDKAYASLSADWPRAETGAGRCAHCKKETRTLCRRCHVAFYCNTGCQEADYERHKQFCGKLHVEQFAGLVDAALRAAEKSAPPPPAPAVGNPQGQTQTHRPALKTTKDVWQNRTARERKQKAQKQKGLRGEMVEEIRYLPPEVNAANKELKQRIAPEVVAACSRAVDAGELPSVAAAGEALADDDPRGFVENLRALAEAVYDVIETYTLSSVEEEEDDDEEEEEIAGDDPMEVDDAEKRVMTELGAAFERVLKAAQPICARFTENIVINTIGSLLGRTFGYLSAVLGSAIARLSSFAWTVAKRFVLPLVGLAKSALIWASNALWTFCRSVCRAVSRAFGSALEVLMSGALTPGSPAVGGKFPEAMLKGPEPPVNPGESWDPAEGTIQEPATGRLRHLCALPFTIALCMFKLAWMVDEADKHLSAPLYAKIKKLGRVVVRLIGNVTGFVAAGGAETEAEVNASASAASPETVENLKADAEQLSPKIAKGGIGSACWKIIKVIGLTVGLPVALLLDGIWFALGKIWHLLQATAKTTVNAVFGVSRERAALAELARWKALLRKNGANEWAVRLEKLENRYAAEVAEIDVAVRDRMRAATFAREMWGQVRASHYAALTTVDLLQALFSRREKFEELRRLADGHAALAESDVGMTEAEYAKRADELYFLLSEMAQLAGEAMGSYAGGREAFREILENVRRLQAEQAEEIRQRVARFAFRTLAVGGMVISAVGTAFAMWAAQGHVASVLSTARNEVMDAAGKDQRAAEVVRAGRAAEAAEAAWNADPADIAITPLHWNAMANLEANPGPAAAQGVADAVGKARYAAVVQALESAPSPANIERAVFARGEAEIEQLAFYKKMSSLLSKALEPPQEPRWWHRVWPKSAPAPADAISEDVYRAQAMESFRACATTGKEFWTRIVGENYKLLSVGMYEKLKQEVKVGDPHGPEGEFARSRGSAYWRAGGGVISLGIAMGAPHAIRAVTGLSLTPSDMLLLLASGKALHGRFVGAVGLALVALCIGHQAAAAAAVTAVVGGAFTLAPLAGWAAGAAGGALTLLNAMAMAWAAAPIVAGIAFFIDAMYASVTKLFAAT